MGLSILQANNKQAMRNIFNLILYTKMEKVSE